MHINEKSLTEKGTDAVKQLRKQRLQRGLPFMINTKDTNAGSNFYLEYPDGVIVLAKQQGAEMEFEVIKELSNEEASTIRIQYQLH